MKITESPAKHRARRLSAGKLSSDSSSGACYLLIICDNPQQGKGCWQTGEQMSCCSGTGSSACPPKTSLHPYTQGLHLQLQLPKSQLLLRSEVTISSHRSHEESSDLSGSQGRSVSDGQCPALRDAGGSPALCTELGQV